MAGSIYTPDPRVGLIGVGSWGRHILRDLVSLHCDVVAVATDPLSRQAADDGGAGLVLSAIDQLPDVDGIVVATSTTSHEAVVGEVVGRGVPVFVEKPLASEAAAAARLAEAGGGRLFVMDKWRYHPGVELLGRLARSGDLGGVQGLRTLRLGWSDLGGDVDPIWRLVPHDLAIALEILGTVPEPRAAVADQLDDRPVGLSGLLGTDPWCTIAVSARSPQRCRLVELRGDDAVAVLADAYSDVVLVYPTRNRRSQPGLPVADRLPISKEFPLRRELRAFVGHLRGGPAPRSSAVEGAGIVSTICHLRTLAGVGGGADG